MSDFLPPTIDPIAAQRWQQAAPPVAPWLHEEVGRRMQERLQWMAAPPAVWCHWHALRGGVQTHDLIAQRYPQAQCYVVEETAAAQQAAQARWASPWWQPWRAGKLQVAMPPELGANMLWANMLLHTQANPLALLRRWHAAVAVDGFVMFSCLGPQTVQTLHQLYATLGWPPAGHSFTDMHDWGDMLIQTGFAEPVMDMETITLSFATPERLLLELRERGRNLHPQRFAGLRGQQWRDRLLHAVDQHLRLPDGQLGISFEIVYGHAFKAAPRSARQWKKNRADLR